MSDAPMAHKLWTCHCPRPHGFGAKEELTDLQRAHEKEKKPKNQGSLRQPALRNDTQRLIIYPAEPLLACYENG
jgi:hypothetical protein